MSPIQCEIKLSDCLLLPTLSTADVRLFAFALEQNSSFYCQTEKVNAKFLPTAPILRDPSLSEVLDRGHRVTYLSVEFLYFLPMVNLMNTKALWLHVGLIQI